jgi:enterochelin esterase-like enzyme
VRLHEYSPGIDPERFAGHERLLLHEVRPWVREWFDAALPAERTLALGLSAGGELALALGLRHPEVFAFWREELPPMVAWAVGHPTKTGGDDTLRPRH